MDTNDEKNTVGKSTEPSSSNMSDRKVRLFRPDPTTSTSRGVSSAGGQTDAVSDTSVDDIGDVTIGDTTLDAAGNATHLPNPSTPPPGNAVLSTQPSSTPFSKSVSGNAHSGRGRDALYPLLENDIKHPTIITFEEFLEDVFQFKSTEDIDPEAICRNGETLDHLVKFKASLKNPEVARYKPFTVLVNHIFTAIAIQKCAKPSIFARPHDKFVVRGSSGAARQPDVIFASKSDHVQSNPLHWSDVKMVLEFKAKQGLDSTGHFSKSREGSDSARSATQSTTSSTTSNISTGSKRWRDPLASDNMPNKRSRTTDGDAKSVELQLASYALESFAHGRYRSHVVHGTVLGSTLRLWFYDRVGVVKSRGVDFEKKPVALVQFLMSIASLTDEAWGFHPAIRYTSPTVIPPTRSLRPRPAPNASHSNNHTDTSSDDDAKEGSTADADYLPNSTPQLEPGDPFIGATITVQGQSFVLGACVFRQYALTGRGTCVIDADGGAAVVKLSWPDEARTPEYEFLDRAYKNGKYPSMTAHLPELLKREDLDITSVPRGRIRALSQESKSSRGGPRTLRATVYTKLHPMTEIRTAEDFKKVMRDVAQCHRWLYRVVGILHRDVSLNNIMFYRDDSTIFGVLIDFDLAQDITKETHSMFDRTGIPLYMAIDLLGDAPTLHFARHDLESMLWVIVWFTYRYENGREIPPGSLRPLDDWFTNNGALQKFKLGFLMKPGGDPTPPFRSLYRTWIKPLVSFFHDGIRALDNYLDEMKDFQQASHQEPILNKPVFGPDQFFYNDTTAWTAFWRILSPNDPIDFEDARDNAHGFYPIGT